jgi:hypothetical protein
MPTKETLREKLAAIDKKKAAQLASLAAQRKRLKASLAKLEKPSKLERRLDARRKILVGSFILDRLNSADINPVDLEYAGVRFVDWLVRPNDRAVFETPSSDTSVPELPSAAARPATNDTPLNVPFADKDQAKALGAHWHADQKRWVVPTGLDLTPFQPWLE